MKRMLVAFSSFALVLILGSCGIVGGSAAPATGPNINVDMTEYKYSVTAMKLKVGTEYRVTLHNAGKKDHEWLVGQQVGQAEGHPDGWAVQFFDKLGRDNVKFEQDGKPLAEAFESEDETAVVLTPSTAPITVIFTPTDAVVGSWEYGCFQDSGGHWEEGMKGTLVVEK